MGFFGLLDLQRFETDYDAQHSRTIRFKSGVESDGELALRLRQEFDRLQAPVEDTHKLFLALTEAMSNAIFHAYPNAIGEIHQVPIDPKVGKRWWLGGTVDTPNQRIKVIFLDQGVGIPFPTLEVVRKAFRDPKNWDWGQ